MWTRIRESSPSRCRFLVKSELSFPKISSGAQSVRDGSAIDAIPITDQVARRLSPRECFGDLACDPVRGRMGCDVDPDEVSAGQPNDDAAKMSLSFNFEKSISGKPQERGQSSTAQR